jgi:DNA-binding transcriptional ArsR family regulator
VAADIGGFEDPPAEVLAEAAAAFGLLASSARLHLVWALAQGESDVTHLADRLGGALPAISQHLSKLKLAGLVRSRREGRRQVYFVDDPHVVTVVRLMVGQLAARTEDRCLRPPRPRNPAPRRPYCRCCGSWRPVRAV